MALLKGERKEKLFLGEQEFKSNAEKKRVLKATEEEKAIEMNELIEKYTDFLNVGEKIKVGVLQIEKKEKDGKEIVKIKYIG